MYQIIFYRLIIVKTISWGLLGQHKIYRLAEDELRGRPMLVLRPPRQVLISFTDIVRFPLVDRYLLFLA